MERTCKLCDKPIRASEPRLMHGPDYWQTFTHQACTDAQARRLNRCSAAGCTQPDRHARGCPAAGDCPQCECCTAAVCRDRSWRHPDTPQHIAAVTPGVCPCEVGATQAHQSA